VGEIEGGPPLDAEVSRSGATAYAWWMRVLATQEAVDHIRERGGQVFVWAISMAYGYQPVFSLEASTESPGVDHEFERFSVGPIDVLLDTDGRELPETVHLDVKGRFRKAIRAYWNGHSFGQGTVGAS
jgi:hypothetical protein